MNTNTKVILVAGFTAGVLDMLAAFLVYTVIFPVTSVKRILQSIASGVHGKAAFEGGLHSAFAGLLGHFFFAFAWAAIFVACYSLLHKYISNKWLLGIFYGCLVWLVMNYLVMPLSAIGHPPKFDSKFTSISLAIVIVCVGIPISVITEKMRSKTPAI